MRRFFTAIVSIVLFINTSQAQCWQKIASTYDHVLSIHEDGTLWTWGGAFSGYRQNNYPIQKSQDNDWVSISAGFYTNAAIKSDGTLWMWGENGFGQLGQGNTTNPRQHYQPLGTNPSRNRQQLAPSFMWRVSHRSHKNRWHSLALG